MEECRPLHEQAIRRVTAAVEHRAANQRLFSSVTGGYPHHHLKAKKAQPQELL